MRNPFKRQPRPIDKPTLKQRAAALKATAARLIRKPKNGPNADAELCALAGPWEAACRLYDRRIEEQSALERAAMLHPSYPGEQPAGAGPDWQDFHQRWLDHCEQSGIAAAEKASGDACLALGDIEDQIAALPARSLAGLQIKARVAERNSSIDVEWPQGLGDGLVADLLSLTGSLPAVPVAPQAAPSVSKPDPIFALIEANRAAEAVMDAQGEKIDVLRTEAERAEHDAAVEEQVRSWQAAFRTPPTTLAGLAALRGWIAWQIERHKVPPQGDGSVWADAYLSLHAALDIALNPASPSPASEDVDWHSPPPGFMAFPAIEPTHFFNIRYGIVAELERLRDIARAEYARREPHFRDSRFAEEELETRLSALRDELRLLALDAAIAGTKATSAGASAAGPDPILAAIEASRTTHAAVEAWSDVAETRTGPLSEGDIEEEKRLCDAQWKARESVVNTVPTTTAGRLALLEWLRWQLENYSLLDGSPPDQHSHFWEFSYKALKAALAWDGPAVVHNDETDADAELIALGRAFNAAAARAQEAEAAHEADRNDEQKLNAANEAAEPAYALAEQIAPLPVHTLAGVHVKLRLAAFYWTCGPRGEHEDEHTGEIAIRSLYRSTPGIVLGTGPFDVRIVPEADQTTAAATEA
nr:hypothetical protein [Methylobacterium sp. L1A1]